MARSKFKKKTQVTLPAQEVNPVPAVPFEHPRFQYDLDNCGLKRALDVIGEKWTLLVLRESFYGLRRFDDFARALGCGRAILSARLKTLTDAGILEQRDYTETSQRSRREYVLTDKGRDLYPAMLALTQWSDAWMPSLSGPMADVLEKRTERPVRVVMTSDPVTALTTADIRVRPGPGARRTRSHVDAASRPRTASSSRRRSARST
jgi:DNA-binding HxlR family transcriptional regulator